MRRTLWQALGQPDGSQEERGGHGGHGRRNISSVTHVCAQREILVSSSGFVELRTALDSSCVDAPEWCPPLLFLG